MTYASTILIPTFCQFCQTPLAGDVMGLRRAWLLKLEMIKAGHGRGREETDG